MSVMIHYLKRLINIGCIGRRKRDIIEDNFKLLIYIIKKEGKLIN